MTEPGRQQWQAHLNVLAVAVPVDQTGSERFTWCVEWVWAWSCAGGYSSCLMIAGSGEFGGVAGPVTSSLAHPFDGCGRCEAEKVSEHGSG
jgi:hypothetical protein